MKLKDNSDNLNQFIDQSKKIDTLERENRTLLTDLELLRTRQEEGLMYQEELKTKDGKIERYEKKMVQSELDIQVCSTCNKRYSCSMAICCFILEET